MRQALTHTERAFHPKHDNGMIVLAALRGSLLPKVTRTFEPESNARSFLK